MLQIDNQTEFKLRSELEFLKDSLNQTFLFIKNLPILSHLCSNDPNSVSVIIQILELQKTKMMLVKEIGERRKNMNILGIKSRYPGDR